MISIKNINSLQLNFKGYQEKKEPSKGYSYDSDYVSSSEAMTSYGKALVTSKSDTEDFNSISERIYNTKDDEIISLKDAVDEFKCVNTTDKKKTDYILSCTFENEKSDVVINKKALLLTKQALLFNAKIPKMEDVMRTCLDDDSKSFNSKKFESLFDYKGRLRISAKLKPRPQNTAKDIRNAKAARRLQIENAVAGDTPSKTENVDFKEQDFFISLDDKKKEMMADIDKIRENSDEMPDDLYNGMKTALKNDDFNLRKVYKDYYSLLNDCKTIDEVKQFYPELEYPQEKPQYDKSRSKDYLDNRLANEDFDKIVISVLKNNYVDMKPKTGFYVNLENSRPTTLTSLERAGFKFSAPSYEIQSVLNKGDEIVSKFENLPELDDEQIKKIANKRAINKSKVWADYSEMTSKNWLPVRLIKYKRLDNVNSHYSTDKMVNTYISYLYMNDKNKSYPANPLEKFDDKNYLSRDMKKIINGTYWARYKKYDEKIKDSADFQQFKSRFDTKAMGKSFEHLEDNYTNTFFRKYWTKERVDSLKNELQPAYDMIYEKIALKEQIQPKQVTDKDVRELIDTVIPSNADKVSDEDMAKFKYLTSGIKNNDLKERCQSCISTPEIVDKAYFDSVNKIIQKSSDENGIDEDKAIMLINLHDKYLNKILNSDEEQSEDEFVVNELSAYKTGDDYDYKRAYSDTKSELEYFNSAERLQTKGEDEFSSIIADRFVFSDKPDYDSANTVIGYYESIPETFRPKYLSGLKGMTKVRDDIFVNEAARMHDKITSWNFDKDEVLVMDKDKIPQKVVITAKAKQELYDAVGDNMVLFDKYLNKFFSAAQNRTGDKKGQGIKTVVGNDYDAELKIVGDGGRFRMYTRPVTLDDMEKYNTGDGINVKYIFDTCDGHL